MGLSCGASVLNASATSKTLTSDKENCTVSFCFFREDILTAKKRVISLTKVLSPLGFYRLNSCTERNVNLTKQIYSSLQTSNPFIAVLKKPLSILKHQKKTKTKTVRVI